MAITTFNDLLMELIGGWFGYDFTLFAFVSLLVLAGAGYLFRLPSILVTILGWGLVYMFDMLGGGQSYLLQIILLLLSIAIAIEIIRGVLSYAKDWSW